MVPLEELVQHNAVKKAGLTDTEENSCDNERSAVVSCGGWWVCAIVQWKTSDYLTAESGSVKGLASTFFSFAGNEGRSHHPRERFLDTLDA
jgi:hypothetical protein